MQITIRPDPDCIELIRSEFKDMVIRFLKSVGIFENDAENWQLTHSIEINENTPPLVDVFEMKCFLPDELFTKPEWVFKFAEEEFFTSFIISNRAVCCKLLNINEFEHLPQKLLNLSCEYPMMENLTDIFSGLLFHQNICSLSLRNCDKLKDISLLGVLLNFQNIRFRMFLFLNLRLFLYYFLISLLKAVSKIFSLRLGSGNLRILNLSGCSSLTNIRTLSGLINSDILDLSGCISVTDISSLAGLSNLQSLNLSGCEWLTDISSLAGLSNLQSLKLDRCYSLTDISSIAGLSNLQSLDLSWCRSLTDISGLSGLLNMQTLNLSNCDSITDISCLSGLLNLKTLNLSYCDSITDIICLSGLLNLQSLNLSKCKLLKNISSLSGLLHLQTLDLYGCELLTDISSLAGLLNLQTLNLRFCKSLTDISNLSGLVNLKSLDLGSCGLITDISGLSGLFNLQELDLSSCGLITNISGLSGLLDLQNLNLSSWRFTDISRLSGLSNLQSLDLSWCESLTDISGLSGLLNLQSLNLSMCRSLTDISCLSGLLHLQTLKLSSCELLTDISSLAGLLNLQTLNLHFCNSLTDISGLSSLVNLQELKLSSCELLTDINSLAGLFNLQELDLSSCDLLTDISRLSKLKNLQYLKLEECKRIQNWFALRNCLALKDLNESKMHPTELAELLCFLAVQRKDTPFIFEKADSWLQELELGFDQKHSSTNDLACSLAQGIILTNLEEVGLSFHQTLLNHSDVVISPWKIWFSANLKTFGWDKIQNLAELNKLNELTFGAIGGISSCLPSIGGDPAQIAWARKWISEIHSLHNNNPNFLKPAAAEWCLALKRLGEDNLLRAWIEKFTDPSDPSALDPINKVFSAYALDLNDSKSALEYALKINDPKLRDESILNLAQQFIKEGETTKAGEFLFLLTQIESRTQLAYSLAEDAAYLKSDENAHRLLAACGDNPQSLASILDKLRLANPSSEILESMHEKLSDESRLHIPASLIMQESNSYTNTLLKIKDPSQLEEIQQAIESIMKSS